MLRHEGKRHRRQLAQVTPIEDIDLEFTGDFHAVEMAHNLLAAMLDNHIQYGNRLAIDPRRIVWKRVVDMNDRASATDRRPGRHGQRHAPPSPATTSPWPPR